MSQDGLPQNPNKPPAPHLGWYSRGYLPHRDHPGLLQTITYRLADSLPAEVLRRIEDNLRHVHPEGIETERRKQMERWLDAGYGSCVLKHPDVARVVLENWNLFSMVRYDLIAWVVMPNHVHVLVRAYEGVDLGKIIQSWKSYTGRRIARMDYHKPSVGEGGIWMRDFWDRFIRDRAHFRDAIDYIHQNPVKAKLTSKAEEWVWSSAREFEA
jgi:REP element-mobilizing transposase RayT